MSTDPLQRSSRRSARVARLATEATIAARAAPLLAGLVAAAAMLVVAPTHAGPRPGPNRPGGNPWECPFLSSPLMFLNGGVCVAAPTNVAVAKNPQPAGGRGGGASPRQGANPQLVVVSLGSGYSTRLAGWIHAGGPPETVTITYYGGNHEPERTMTLHNAKPLSFSGANVLTLSYSG
jgi:hypothetical protein